MTLNAGGVTFTARVPGNRRLTAGETVYGVPFACAVARGNVFAVQFHPEKSQAAGLRLLANFVGWQATPC